MDRPRHDVESYRAPVVNEGEHNLAYYQKRAYLAESLEAFV